MQFTFNVTVGDVDQEIKMYRRYSIPDKFPFDMFDVYKLQIGMYGQFEPEYKKSSYSYGWWFYSLSDRAVVFMDIRQADLSSHSAFLIRRPGAKMVLYGANPTWSDGKFSGIAPTEGYAGKLQDIQRFMGFTDISGPATFALA